MNKNDNIFKEMGAASQPYEREAFQKRRIQSLIATNYDLYLKNQQLQYLLQLEKQHTDQILDQIYLLADTVTCKTDRKKLRHAAIRLEQRLHRRNYRASNEFADYFKTQSFDRNSQFIPVFEELFAGDYGYDEY